jgi:hypothetical protein
MQTRRRSLQLAGTALAGLAGCVSTLDGEGDGTDATDDGPTGDDGTATDRAPTDRFEDVALSDMLVREAVAYYRWPGSTEVLAPSDEQFVVAQVTGPEEATAPRFVFRADGREWVPGIGRRETSGPASVAGRDGGSATEDFREEGYLAFRVPSPIDAADPRIVAPDRGASLSLSDAATERLAGHSPMFALERVEVPESVTHPSPVDVALTVRNTSDVDGRFVAGLHWPTELVADDDETTVVEGQVAAGETASFSASLDTEYAVRETTDHPLTISGYVDAERSVRVVREGTTTG